MNSPTEYSWFSKAKRFAEAAISLCDYLDETDGILYEELCGLLLDVCRAELALEWPSEEYDDELFWETDSANDSWHALEAKLRKLFEVDVKQCDVQAQLDDYQMHWTHMIPSDLSELYDDLAEGLRCWQMHDHAARLHATWLWKSQAAHWSEHLCRALWTIQQLRFKWGWVEE